MLGGGIAIPVSISNSSIVLFVLKPARQSELLSGRRRCVIIGTFIAEDQNQLLSYTSAIERLLKRYR
jgi:hypothetical protein